MSLISKPENNILQAIFSNVMHSVLIYIMYVYICNLDWEEGLLWEENLSKNLSTLNIASSSWPPRIRK